MINIYVFNLDSTLQGEDLKDMFSVYGKVASAEIIKDIMSGESRGFGYIKMDDHRAAHRAIEALN
jgi:RNA recognition motif-containing protein